MAEHHIPEITFIRNRPSAADATLTEHSPRKKPTSSKPGASARPRRKRVANAPTVSPDERLRHILAIALVVSAILILLALVSYTALDEANTDLRIADVSGLMTNDPVVIARADTTNNWLGLLGAVLANFLINGTVGYGVIVVPFLLGLWGVTVFKAAGVERSTRTTLYTLGVTSIAASILGTLQLIPWLPTPSHEWSGAIGSFVSSILSGLVGTAGSMLMLFATLAITLIYAIDIDVRSVVATLKALAHRSQSWIVSTLRHFSPLRDWSIDTRSDTPERASRSQGSSDEPARMIRRRKGAELQVPLEPRIALPVDASYHPSRSPLPDLQQAAPPVIDRQSAGNESELPATALAELVPEARNHDEIRKPAPIGLQTTVELTHSDDPTPTPGAPARLTLNVQEGETADDKESVKGDTLQSGVRDEVIRYVAPAVSLLTPQYDHEEVQDDELKENGRVLQEKLGTFNIQIENLTVTPGPVVTLYEFVPAAGIKISQIESLTDDIALAMKARGIRIIAPIPGKGTVGVEIPNHKPTMVRIRSVLNTAKFREADLRLPLALGKTTIGEVYCADLTRMPHLLIAGATGSGKSVGINAILASLIYKMHPRDLKLVIVDPKKIELTQYKTLVSHFLAQCPDIDEDIITTPQNAVLALKSLEMEMDRRYDILAKGRQRNIFDYNQKVTEGAYASIADFDHRKLPYIVLILDELADLMITARGEVEEPIARLAQLARAVGIHMVVATQRPSVDVLTGTIKANFPARIAYQVASKIDSRTILDMSGAEYLLGNGDMLYLPGGSPKPIRLQNAFISTEEVEEICNHIGSQQGYTTPYMLPSMLDKRRNGVSGVDTSRDDLFEEAARLVVRHQQGSVSLVQRRLKVGYSRAARIIDELEMAGIVGPFDGSKARQVLVEDEDDLDIYI